MALKRARQGKETSGCWKIFCHDLKHYGEIRSDLEKRGTPIGVNDLHIAGHARSEGLTVVTNNEKEFTRVSGLRVENWL